MIGCNNKSLEKQALEQYKKGMITGIILTSITMTSAILVGMGIFDRNNTLGKAGFIVGTIGFIPLAGISLLFLALLVDDINNRVKNNRGKIPLPRGVVLSSCIVGTILAG